MLLLLLQTPCDLSACSGMPTGAQERASAAHTELDTVSVFSLGILGQA